MTEAITSHDQTTDASVPQAAAETKKATLADISIHDLIEKIRNVHDGEARRQLMQELTNLSRPQILAFLNAHAVNVCWSDLEARRSFASADILLRDGAGMAILYQRLGMASGLNMNGTDFIPCLLLHRPEMRVALLGGIKAANFEAAKALKALGVNVIAALDGFQATERYIAEACAQKPDIIVLGMGMPKQEKLAVQLRESLDHPCLIVNGGAIIDFLAKRVPRAPQMMQNLGLEWTWRLFNEPVRLFTRYVIGNPLFLFRTQSLARAKQAKHSTRLNESALVRGIVIASPGGEEGRGGMGTVTKLMARQFRSRHPDCPITIIDPRGHGSIIQTPHQTLRALLQLRRAAMRGANVLHLQVSERSSFLRKGLLALAARKLGMTVILHHHGAELIPFYRNASRGMQRYVRYVADLADMNIVLGHIWSRFLVDETGVPQQKIVVLRNGVPDLATVIARNPSPGNRVRLLSLAQLSERKGTGDILLALLELEKNGLDVEVVLAGGGDISKYKNMASQLRVSHRVIFTGWIDRTEVERQLSIADIFILPSDNEGLPMAIIEALSLKIPVIATPVGAIPEVLQDDRDCKLVPPHDPKALAAAIAELSASPDLMQSLAEAGRKTYTSELTLDIFTQRLWALYEAAIRRKQI